jgi:hypothetical protein
MTENLPLLMHITQTDVTVTLFWTFIQELNSSNIGEVLTILTEVLVSFPQSPKENAK